METQVDAHVSHFAFKQVNKKAFVLNGISIFLGFIFFSSGLAKLFFEHKFPGLIGPVWLEARLEEYNLGLFARFVAYAQVTIGFLLLTLRYRTLGAISLLPMLLNILVITISLDWQGTPYVIAVFLVLNLLLLLAEAPKLLHLIGFKTTLPIQASQNPGKMGLLWLSGFALVLLSINISYFNLQLAYIFNATGVFTALYSFYKGGRV
ncbi:hypothetical protein [Adhaeribacter rhizoryzae]|uniref:DoxX family membrane protein n=1 Tax=Adhaeribacter rhizoryzae TaxID=2607907 RepID=A0A5M6DR56_9BACT|nr:hypothetical protein [Adhaeribacter rhizoryzae]KAA5548836.1 hypothetical protein F0145_04810 [Adhaeribacter rhizoryzae]